MKKMLSKPLAFEQDKNAIFLRNQIMHLHYTKLSDIKKRKNTYLPEISQNPNRNALNLNHSINFNIYNNLFGTNINNIPKESSCMNQDSKSKEANFYINRDNYILFSKLRKIRCRSNQIMDDSEIISGYLNVKKNTRKRVRAIKNKLLQEQNDMIKSRIRETKPMIDNIQFKKEFNTSQKISGYLRKIQPSGKIGIYLTKGESDKIRRYDKERLNKSTMNIRDMEYGIGKSGRLDYCNINNISSNKSIDVNKSGNKSNVNDNKNISCPKIDKRILAKVRYVGYRNDNQIGYKSRTGQYNYG